MQLAVLEFTPIMQDIQTTLTTMSNMVVNHVQITQAVCAGFPVKASSASELDVLISNTPGYLSQQDIEKVHLCGELIFDFLVQQLQPYAVPRLLRYGCPGFFQTQGYVLMSQYHDDAFFKEFVNIQANITTQQLPIRKLMTLEQVAESSEMRIAELNAMQLSGDNSVEVHRQIARHQNYLDRSSGEMAKIRIKQ
ncbi:hypothetical protein Ea357_214 [Erwinia phage Ea35-70]|uniref:Uncharacterized protein n=1 Tax=Erwinia phage Ea35-70 TaxID=1429768 RepID=W6ARV3_9CAUD|nr:hypothetical protein Ea357_214 [Erwinia phage Ea35-70]AHI60367.1 hypothetical protein Ea357_214 [Erwinia phage Ea35-70]